MNLFTKAIPVKPLRALILTAVCLLALVPAGCGPQKGETATPGSGRYGKPLATLSAELAQASTAEWTTLQVPVSVKLRSAGVPTLGGTMYMERDTEIRLSLRFLGMEMAAARITPDSVTAYVKPQRMYVAEGISGLTGAFPASIGNLQSLLLGRLFTLGSAVPELRGADIVETPTGYSITPRSPLKGTDYSFGILLPANRVGSLTFEQGSRRVQAVYTDPDPSYKIELSALTGSRTMQADISVDASKARWNEPLPRSRFAVPKGYRRISAPALLKALNSIIN